MRPGSTPPCVLESICSQYLSTCTCMTPRALPLIVPRLHVHVSDPRNPQIPSLAVDKGDSEDALKHKSALTIDDDIIFCVRHGFPNSGRSSATEGRRRHLFGGQGYVSSTSRGGWGSTALFTFEQHRIIVVVSQQFCSSSVTFIGQ